MAALELFLHEELVGVVEPDRRDPGRVTLSVDASYPGTVLLSEGFTTLPGSRTSVEAISNFLGGYVPEGNHREKMAAKRRIDAGNLFALLGEFGASVAGAVNLRSPGDSATHRPKFEALTPRTLAARLKQALEESDQGIADDSRSMLPGYQPKVLVAQIDGQWAYPHGRAHSTWILKPLVPARPTRLYDEHYSHLLAQHLGLSSYRSEIRKAAGVTYLAIERFDRELHGDRVALHHQEDLAQALALDWRDSDAKFQDPQWPTKKGHATARAIGELLGSIPGGDAAVEQWLRQLTFHVLIGNNDAHAKNVALMHHPGGTELSPLYDAVPNLFQEGLVSFDLALAIDGTFDHRRISAERLITEAGAWGAITRSRAEAIVVDTLQGFAEALGAVKAPKQISERLGEQLQWNTRRLQAGEDISTPKPQSAL